MTPTETDKPIYIWLLDGRYRPATQVECEIIGALRQDNSMLIEYTTFNDFKVPHFMWLTTCSEQHKRFQLIKCRRCGRRKAGLIAVATTDLHHAICCTMVPSLQHSPHYPLYMAYVLGAKDETDDTP